VNIWQLVLLLLLLLLLCDRRPGLGGATILIPVRALSCVDENKEFAGTDTTDAMSVTGSIPVSRGSTPAAMVRSSRSSASGSLKKNLC
jgi:hypothetical protein